MTHQLLQPAIRTLVVAAALLSALVLAPPPSAEARIDSDAEARFIDSVNAERASRGLPRLQAATDLRNVARRHSVRMADRNHLHHNPNLASDVTSWRRLTENVGRGSTTASLHRALMDSPGHRANILDRDVSQIGVGVEVRGGTVWVTQVFRRPTSLPAPSFSDVPRSSSHARDVDRLARAGVTVGCGKDRYCPQRSVSRAEMGTFLARASALVPRNPDRFTDTGQTSVHAANIEAIRVARITQGCSSTRFCPTRNVTRAEMASFLARAVDLPIRGTTTRYSDVADGSTHAGAIEALGRAGITNGCGNGRYCPNRAVTREEMASFLVRAFSL